VPVDSKPVDDCLAITAPTPSASASSSTDAARMASMLPKCAARARAAVGPTCLMENATMIRHSGWDFACSRLAMSFSPLAEEHPPAEHRLLGIGLLCRARVERDTGELLRRQCEQVTLVGDHPDLEQRDHAFRSRAASMSNAERDARLNNRSRSCAGRSGRWAADVLVALLLRRERGLAGRHSVGITNARSVPSRSATTGPTISGMTSPALRSTTVSPISTPLRSTSHWLCRVAISTVETGDLDRLHDAERRHPAGCADIDADVEQLGVDLFRRVLVRDRPPRRPAGRTEPPLQGQVVDLHDGRRRSRARHRADARRNSR